MISIRNDLKTTRQNALVDHLQLVIFPKYGSHKKHFTRNWWNSFYKSSKSCNNDEEESPWEIEKVMYPKLLIDILGWTGSILYLVAYALVSTRKTEGDSLVYQGMNIVAGTLLIVYTLSLGAYATTGLNAVWVAIGLFTLGRKWIIRS